MIYSVVRGGETVLGSRCAAAELAATALDKAIATSGGVAQGWSVVEGRWWWVGRGKAVLW